MMDNIPPQAQTNDNPTLGLPAAPVDEAPTLRQDGVSPIPPAPIDLNIPGYELLEVLGQGGMSVVYKARQVTLDRLVAVKVIRSGADTRERARLRAEAEATARLRHINIVQIHEIGEHEGALFLSLEFCAGGSLDRVLAGTPLPAPDAARLLHTLAQAVQAAHDAGIVHRDLKPANVLLSSAACGLASDTAKPQAAERAIPKIADFGLAKKLDASGQTTTGVVLGTPSYMPPEQALGMKSVGPHSDIYSLGAILYECLTGRPPFKAATVLETLNQLVGEDPVPPTSLQPGVPRDLETICLVSLHKDPGKRYAQASQLADDLNRFLAGEPIRARPASMPERARKWARRHPTSAVALGMAGLLLAALIGGGLIHNSQLREALAAADLQSDRAEKEARAAADQRYAADLRLAQQYLRHGDVFRMAELIDPYHTPALKDGAGQDDRRCFVWSYLDRQRRLQQPTIHAHPDAPILLAYSPDGRTLASANWAAETSLKLWEVPSGRLRLKRKQRYSTHPSAFSADGRTFAVSINLPDRLIVGDAATGAERTVLAEAANCPALSADGKLLAFVTFRQELVIRDLSTQKELSRFTFEPANQSPHLAFAPNGQTLALGTFAKVLLWEQATSKVERVLDHYQGGICDLSWSRSSGFLAVACGNTLTLWDTSRWVALCRWTSPLGTIHAVAFSPDERMLALGASEGQVLWWDIIRQELAAVSHWQRRRISRLAFSPDGRTLAAATEDGIIHRIEARPPRPFDRLRPRWRASNLCYSPDGKALAVADSHQGVLLLDADTLEVKTRLGHPRQRIGQLTFVPGQHPHRLVTADADDGRVILWDVASGVAIRELPSIGVGYRCLTVSGDGKRVALAGAKGTVLWDLDTGSSQTLNHGGSVRAVAFTPDGRQLACVGDDRIVKLWDLNDGTTGKPAEIHPRTVVSALSFHPDGQHLVLLEDTGQVQVWRRNGATDFRREEKNLPTTGRTCERLQWAEDGQALLSGLQRWRFPDRKLATFAVAQWTAVTTAAWSPNGKRVAAVLPSGAVEVWDFAQQEVQRPAGSPRMGPIHSLAFTPDSRRLITASRLDSRVVRHWSDLLVRIITENLLQQRTQDSLSVWDVKRGELTSERFERTTWVAPHQVALAPDGKLLFAGGEDGCVWVWDRPTGRLLQRLFVSQSASTYLRGLELAVKFAAQVPISMKSPDPVQRVVVAPSGRWLAVWGGKGQVRVWRVGDWTRPWDLPPDEPIGWAGFDRTDQLVVSVADRLIWWDVEQRIQRRTIETNLRSPVTCGAFAPDGRWLATGMEDGHVALWSLPEGELKELTGHTDRVSALAFNPDSRILASGGHDRTVRLWSMAARREIAVLEGHRGKVWSVCFAPDGGTLASGGEAEDGTGEVLLWRAGD